LVVEVALSFPVVAFVVVVVALSLPVVASSFPAVATWLLWLLFLAVGCHVCVVSRSCVIVSCGCVVICCNHCVLRLWLAVTVGHCFPQLRHHSPHLHGPFLQLRPGCCGHCVLQLRLVVAVGGNFPWL